MATGESIRWKCVCVWCVMCVCTEHYDQAKGDTSSLLQYLVRRLLLIRCKIVHSGLAIRWLTHLWPLTFNFLSCCYPPSYENVNKCSECLCVPSLASLRMRWWLAERYSQQIRFVTIWQGVIIGSKWNGQTTSFQAVCACDGGVLLARYK